jgi:hypothetical protein
VTRLLAHVMRRAVRVYLRNGRMLVAADKVELWRCGPLELALIRHRRPGGSL